MNAKEYLQRVNKANAIIAGKMAEIQKWEDIATNITPSVQTARIGGKEYGLERVKSSQSRHDKIADAVAVCVDTQTELLDDIRYYKDIIADVTNAIEQLPAVEYQVVHGLYIQGKTLWDMADELDKSYSAVATAHSRAIRDLDEILKQ